MSFALVLGVHFGLCMAGTFWMGSHGVCSPIWPAAGFALFVGARYEPRHWWGLSLAKLAALWCVGQPLSVALVACLVEPAKPFVARLVIGRFPVDFRVPTLRNLGSFLFAAWAVSTVGSLLNALGMLVFFHEVQLFGTFVWFAGDFLGIITMAPILLLSRGDWGAFLRHRSQLGLLSVFAIVVVGCSTVLFTDARNALSSGFVLIPLLGWAATILCVEAVLALNLVFVAAASLLLASLIGQQDLFVVSLLGAGVMNSLILIVVTSERRRRDLENAEGIERLRRVNTELQEHQSRLEGILSNLPDAVVIPDGRRIVFSNKAAGVLAAELCIIRGSDCSPWDWLTASDAAAKEGETRSFVHTESVEGRDVLHLEIQVSPVVWLGRSLRLYVIHDFSEHQALAQEAWRMHARFERLFQLSPNPITLTSLNEGLVLESNDAFLALCSCTRDELSSKPLSDFGFWMDREARQAFIGRLRSHGQVDRLEMHYVDRRGRSFLLHMTSRVISSAGEECILSVFDDLTERRQTQDHLRESQDRFRLLVENIQDLVLEMDQDGVIQYVSPNYNQLQGHRPEQVLGARLGDFLSAASSQTWSDFVREQGHGGLLLELMAADGSLRYVQSFSNWCIAPSGSRSLIVTLRDISEQRQLEHRVHEEQLRFVRLFQLSPNAIILSRWDDGHVIEINEAFLKLMSVPRERLVGRSTVELGLFQSAQHRQESLGRFNLEIDGSIIQHEVEMAREDGTRLMLSMNIRRMRIGAEDLLLCVIENITERRKLESQLRQSQKLEAIGTLAGGIAHDFNNVLTAIIGNAELALMDLPKESQVAPFVSNILSASGRARDLVSQILTFSRKKEQQRILASVTPIIKEMVQLIRATLPANIHILPHLPNEGAKVFCDVSQIHQVLMNLCTNAAYAMKANGGTLTIREELVEVDAEMASSIPHLKLGGHVKISVRDTGCGMSEETLSRIFEPFFTTKPQGEGTGLGLAVAHGIMEAHGGGMSVYSRQGQGTVFNLFIPIAFGQAGMGARRELPELPKGHGQRILIIDDEKIVLDMLTRMLTRLGYVCDACDQTQDAVRLLQEAKQPYDLVISDYSMPTMSGIQLAQTVFKLHPKQAFLLMSGFLATTEQDLARQAGITHFVDKPLNHSAVADMVAVLLP